MKRSHPSLLLACLAAAAQVAHAVPKWCGTEGCYQVLGVKESADPKEIRVSYYKLSRAWHPDKNKHPDAQMKFQRIAKAYEVLSDERSRKRYDYALAHPEEEILEEPYGVWKYWRTDVRLVVLGFFAAVSAIQYFGKKAAYDSAFRKIKDTPKYKNRRAQLVAEWEATAEKDRRTNGSTASSGGSSDSKAVVLGGGNSGGKVIVQSSSGAKAAVIGKAPQASRAERRASARGKSAKGSSLPDDVSKEIDAQMESEVGIHGSYGRPTYRDTLAYHTVVAPYWFAKWAWWQGHWYWAYNLMRQEFTPDDQAYLTREALHWRAPVWEGFAEGFREELVGLRLWEPDNMKSFRREVKQGKRKMPKMESMAKGAYNPEDDPWAGIGDD